MSSVRVILILFSNVLSGKCDEQFSLDLIKGKYPAFGSKFCPFGARNKSGETELKAVSPLFLLLQIIRR